MGPGKIFASLVGRGQRLSNRVGRGKNFVRRVVRVQRLANRVGRGKIFASSVGQCQIVESREGCVTNLFGKCQKRSANYIHLKGNFLKKSG